MPEQQRTAAGNEIVLSDAQVDTLWTEMLDGVQAPARRATAAWQQLGRGWADAPPRTVS